jgi:hypothetical protein
LPLQTCWSGNPCITLILLFSSCQNIEIQRGLRNISYWFKSWWKEKALEVTVWLYVVQAE